MYTSLNIAISLKRTSFSTLASLLVNSSIVPGRGSNHQFPSLGKTKIHWQDWLPVHQNHLRRQWHELMKARLSELGKCLHLCCLQKLPKRAFCARSKKNTKSHTFWCVSFLRFGFLEKKISNTSSLRTQTLMKSYASRIFTAASSQTKRVWSPQLRLKPNGFGCNFFVVKFKGK